MSTTRTLNESVSTADTAAELEVVRAIAKELGLVEAGARRVLTVFMAVVDCESVSLTGWRYGQHASDIKHLLRSQPIRTGGAHDLLNRYFLPESETFSVRLIGRRQRPVELLITNRT